MKTLIGIIAGLVVLFFGIYFGMKFWGGDDAVENVACTMDAKLCPDGSYVGRIAPDCEFAACPTSSATSTNDTEDVFEPQAS